MKRILFLMMGVYLALSAFARDFDYTYEGQTLSYTVIDENTRTVSVKGPSVLDNSNLKMSVSGILVIPEVAIDGDIEYIVTSIGEYAFSGCHELTSVTIANTIQFINDWAFSGCYSMTYLSLGNSVQTIGERTFDSCSGIMSLTIPDSVTSIGDFAFKDCYSLKTVSIGNSVQIIGKSAFCACSALTSIILGCSVKIIDESAFSTCTSLSSIVIPDSVISIGQTAFYGCSNMTSVYIGNSVETIGPGAFIFCNGLTKADFESIESLCSIKFSNGESNPLYYANNLFIDGVEIKDLNIPDSITTINDHAFNCCKNLNTVIIPNSVSSIGNYAFYRCSGLTSVDIPDSVTSIGWYAFGYCSNLTSLTISNSVSRIGCSAFEECKSITSVTIPNSINVIEGDVFRGCNGLTKVEFYSIESLCSIRFCNDYSNPLCYAHNLYIDGIEIKDLDIPASITSIGDWAFSGCDSLHSVTIGNSVQTIGESAFQNCGDLTDIIIGKSVSSIGIGAFSLCDKIKGVYSLSPIVPKGKNCFGDVSNAVLYVHKESKYDYSVADSWSKFPVIYALDDLLQLSINEEYLALEMNDTATLTITPISHPELMVAGTEVWTSDNETVATVENGMITAVGGGLTNITYSVKDQYDIIHSISSEVKVAYLKGDANGNGSLAVNDVVLTERGVVKDYDPALIIEAVDFNGDNILTVGDLTQVVQNVISYSAPNRVIRQNINNVQDQFSSYLSLSLTQNGQDIYVGLDSDNPFTGIQFDVVAEENMTISHVTLEGLSKQNHSEACHMFNSGVLRVLTYGTEVFPSNESFAIIHTQSDSPRPYTLNFTNVMASDFYGNLYRLPDCDIYIGSISEVDSLSDNGSCISAEGRTIVITSRKDSKVVISDMEGNSTIETIHPGINRFYVHSGGVYTVNNKKIIIH